MALNNKTISSGVLDILNLDGGVSASTPRNVKDGVGNATPLYLTTTRLGIGESSPDTTLHIKDASTHCLLKIEASANTYDPKILFTSNGGDQWQLFVDESDSNKIKFYDDVNNVTRVTIDQSGRLGIGTTAPSKKLHISEASGTVETKLEGDSFSSGEYARNLVSGMKSGGTDRHSELGIYYQDQSSAGGSNESCGYIRMDAGDGASNYIWFENDDELRMHTAVSAVGSNTGTSIQAMSSDERLKDISSDAFPYGLSQVNSLTPIKFKWKKNTAKGDCLGFGAQTVKSIIPEIVKDSGICIDGYKWQYDSNGEETHQIANSSDTKLTVEYVALIPVLVKAIQELSAKVTALESA